MLPPSPAQHSCVEQIGGYSQLATHLLCRWGPHESPGASLPLQGEDLGLVRGSTEGFFLFPEALSSSELISSQERGAVALLPDLVA